MKFKFTQLLPLLIVVMILYEFATFGFTIDASVNKIVLGIFYGIVIYILAFIIKSVVVSVLGRIRSRRETEILRYIER